MREVGHLIEISLYDCQVFISCNVIVSDEIGMNAKFTVSDLPKCDCEEVGSE